MILYKTWRVCSPNEQKSESAAANGILLGCHLILQFITTIPILCPVFMSVMTIMWWVMIQPNIQPNQTPEGYLVGILLEILQTCTLFGFFFGEMFSSYPPNLLCIWSTHWGPSSSMIRSLQQFIYYLVRDLTNPSATLLASSKCFVLWEWGYMYIIRTYVTYMYIHSSPVIR